jgi:hypothetical protein
MPAKRAVVRFALFAFVATAFFTQITYSRFEKVKKKIVTSVSTPQNHDLTIPLPEISRQLQEVIVLSLKLKNEGMTSKKILIYSNSSELGVLSLKGRQAREYFLDLGEETIRPVPATLSLQGPDDEWQLLNIKIGNLYGFSRGLIEYILIPKATRTYQRHGFFLWLFVFFIFFLLEAVSTSLKTPHLGARVSRFVRFMALFVIICAALLPIVSVYRILFSFRSLWMFLPFLYLSATLRLFKIFYRKALATIKLSWIPRGLREITSPHKNTMIAFSLSALVFFFYFHIMLDYLKLYQGNFSGFLSLRADLVTGINPLFWDTSPELLFENSDFEKGTLENWTATGDAFLFQPTKGASIPPKKFSMPFNYQGKFWIGTNEKFQGRPGETRGTKQGDGPSGTLTSVPFVIKKNNIGFLIGGGGFHTPINLRRESAALEVSGKIVMEGAGKNREMMELQVWEVTRWKGQWARIILTDTARRPPGWRHINADWFHYYQEDRMSRIQKNLLVSPTGYDAQFFYFMTYDPFLLRFSDEPRKYRVLADEPRYRYERIGFPLLTKVVSLDRPEFYPQAMMILILLSHFLGAFFLVRIVQFFGQSPFWALSYILVPGYQLSLARALPESLVMAFILAGLYFYLKGKILKPSFLFSISLLTRETAALAVFPLILWEFFKGKNRRKALVLSLSFLPLIGWKFYLMIRLFDFCGWTTLFVGLDNLTLPFYGILELFRKIQAKAYNQDLIPATIPYPILLTILFLFSLYLLWKKRDFLSLSLCLFSLLSVSLSYLKVWVHIDNAVRITCEPFLFLIIVFVAQKKSLRKPLVWLILGFFIFVFIYDFYFLTSHDYFRAGFFLE